MFAPGPLTGSQAQFLNELEAAYRKFGLRVGTVYPLTYEAAGGPQGQIIALDPAAVGSSLGVPVTVENLDGTAVDNPTSTIITDQTTGLQTAGTAGTSTLSNRDASPTQTGVVNTTTQVFAGEKRFNGAVVRTADTNTGHSGTTLYPDSVLDVTADLAAVTANGKPLGGNTNAADVWSTDSTVGSGGVTTGGDVASVIACWTNGGAEAVFGAAGFLGSGASGKYEQGFSFYTLPAGKREAPRQVLTGFDVYADGTEWGASVTTAPIRSRRTWYVASGKTWGATRSGTDYDGQDTTLAAGETGTFKAGLLVSKTGTAGTVTVNSGSPTNITGYLKGNGSTISGISPIPYADLANVTAARLLGRTSASTGTPQEITAGTGLAISGTALNCTVTGNVTTARQTVDIGTGIVLTAYTPGVWTATGATAVATLGGTVSVGVELRLAVTAGGAACRVSFRVTKNGTAVANTERQWSLVAAGNVVDTSKFSGQIAVAGVSAGDTLGIDVNLSAAPTAAVTVSDSDGRSMLSLEEG